MSDYTDFGNLHFELTAVHVQSIRNLYKYEPEFAKTLIDALESQSNLTMLKIVDCFCYAFSTSRIREKWIAQQKGADYLEYFTHDWKLFSRAWELLKTKTNSNMHGDRSRFW